MLQCSVVNSMDMCMGMGSLELVSHGVRKCRSLHSGLNSGSLGVSATGICGAAGDAQCAVGFSAPVWLFSWG